MKITFLTRSLNYGGAERQLVALAKGLHEFGHSVAVAVFYPNGPLERDLHNYRVPVHILEKQGRWDVFFFLLRLIRFLHREKPEILHSYLGVPNIFAVLLKLIFPNIRVVWGIRASDVDLNRYDWLARLSYRVERWLSRFADLIIVNSHAGFDYSVAHGFPKNKMIVLPNGINTEQFRPDLEARKRVRAEWGVTEDEKIIGLVGRLDPMKDHPTFLKAAARLSQERNDVHFVCIGDGPDDYRNDLQALGKELGLMKSLFWAGARGDMPAVYNALDICSSSSSYGEGFPNAVGEAMACGVPCIVTNVGDSRWIVDNTGIVVPPSDPESLAEGWRTCLRSDLKGLGDKARSRILKCFDASRLISQTEDILLQRFDVNYSTTEAPAKL